MIIIILAGELAIGKAADFSGVDWQSEFLFLARTDEEFSIVCPSAKLPGNCQEISAGWIGLRVEGQLDFSLTGILSGISAVLAAASISIFAISTFNTDYILIKAENLGKAVSSLHKAGYVIQSSIVIRGLMEDDATDVSQLIGRNFREVNSRDYPAAEMERMVAYYSPDKIVAMAGQGHFYVACSGETVVGCGQAAASDHEDECCLKAIFVNPDWHGCGIGRLIMQALENDCAERLIKRVVLDASITAVDFYKRLGYAHDGGEAVLNEDGLYRMVKLLESR